MPTSDRHLDTDQPRLQQVDDDLVARVYAREFTRLAALGRTLTGDVTAGEDLAHEVFVDVVRRWRRQPGFLREPAWPYLRMALRHLAAHRRRRLLRDLLTLARLDHRQPADLEAQTAGAIDLLALLSQLPPRMRACTVLVYLEDVSLVAAAAALGISPRTVETQLRLARRRLAGLLATTGTAREQTPVPTAVVRLHPAPQPIERPARDAA